MRRRTSVSGDFSATKRRTAARSSSCASRKAKFMPPLLYLCPVACSLRWVSTRPGCSATNGLRAVPRWGYGTAGEHLERCQSRGPPDRGRPDGQQRLHPALPPDRRRHAHRRRQRARGPARDLSADGREPSRGDPRALGPHPGGARGARGRDLGGRDQRRRRHAAELRPDPRGRGVDPGGRPEGEDPDHAGPHTTLHLLRRGGDEPVVSRGQVHALMGPNGAGKSTLAGALLGHPAYKVTAGSILLNGDDVTGWPTDVRAKAGIFLAFQYPEAIEGVSVTQFLRQAMAARKGDEVSVLEVRVLMTEWMERLGLDTSFASRHLNQGFSGGEKKRNEILQMALLEPLVAVLDETDSGLDIDALRVVGRGGRAVRGGRPALGVLAITHYERLLEELVPDAVHILVGGRIVES